jgi:predicted DNA-binding WGR domain protein
VRFGRIGTPGQERVKSYADRDAAQQAAERMISQKIGKGYEEKPRSEDNPSVTNTTDDSEK